MRLQLSARRCAALLGVVASLLASVAAAQAPTRVALLPIVRGAEVPVDDARQLHGWLTTLLALRDDIEFVGAAELDRGAASSRVRAVGEAVAVDAAEPASVALLGALVRGGTLGRLLVARVDQDGGRRVLRLLVSTGGPLRLVRALRWEGDAEAVRPKLRDAVGRWIHDAGQAAPAMPVGVLVDAPRDPRPAAAAQQVAPTAGTAAASGAAPAAVTDQGGGRASGARGAAAPADAPLVVDAAPAPATPLGVSGDARTNVYADNDGNRIVTPSVSAEAELGESVRIAAHGALDIMTCASVDVRTAATPHGYFQETRREAGGGVTVAHGLSKTSLSVTGSRENDYGSVSVALGWSDEFAQRNTTLTLGYSFTDSDVGRAHDPAFDRDLDSHTLSGTVTQVLSRTWIAQASLWLGVLDGFQSSVYRYVRFSNGSAGPERMPSLRVREAGAVQVRGALAQDLFVGASYRLYGDSWGLLAHSGEAQLSYLPVPSVVLRLRDRLHIQRGSPYYQSRFERPTTFMSIDRELGSFWGNLVGAKVSWQPGQAFATRQLGLDLKVDAMWQHFDDFPWLPERSWIVAELGLTATF